MIGKRIGVGLLGIGVIGSKVASVLLERQSIISAETGCEVYLKKIKVLPSDLERPIAKAMEPSLFTTSDDEFFNDPDIQIVIELIGGEHPAFEYQVKSLQCGKHVVTANKEVLAKHHIELFELANANKVTINFEAAVGGGIPIIAPLTRDLILNRVNGIQTIINGTTNYILTKMADEGLEFDEALKQAQQLGYAESNPANDVHGIDACYKLAILSTLAFNTPVYPSQIAPEGITSLDSADFKYAKELGCVIKLLAIAKQDENDEVEVRVHPVFIPKDAELASVNGVFNAVLINGDLTGNVTFIGKGAGPDPTSSAVVSDVVKAARAIVAESFMPVIVPNQKKRIKALDEIVTHYYLRLTVADECGILAQIASALGENSISIASCIQKDADKVNGTVQIVIMTHPALESNIQKAVEILKQSSNVKKVHNLIRVEV